MKHDLQYGIYLLLISFFVQYGVVLDAGSTHTSMFVYNWKVSDIFQGTALVKQIGQCTVTDKGINISMSLLLKHYKLFLVIMIIMQK